MNQKIADRLAKLLEVAGRDTSAEGERLAALSQAHKLMDKHGMTFEKLVRGTNPADQSKHPKKREDDLFRLAAEQQKQMLWLVRERDEITAKLKGAKSEIAKLKQQIEKIRGAEPVRLTPLTKLEPEIEQPTLF